MENVRELPAGSLEAILSGPALQELRRQAALSDLARLRKEASAEIERLIAFLDASDDYVMGEQEINGDEQDASYPEGSARLLAHPNEDDEDDNCGEPSLGSIERHPSGYGPDGRNWTGDQTTWACGGTKDLEDEHDGREPEDEGGEAVHEDDEPSLGWTDEEAARGREYAGSRGQSADLEDGVDAVRPQNRTELEQATVRVECSYRRFVHGLTSDQRRRLIDRRRTRHHSDNVVIS